MNNLGSSLVVSAVAIAIAASLITDAPSPPTDFAHGTVTYPMSRVYRVYKSNVERPNFTLAANAVKIDSKSSYYTWNEVSRNIPEAVKKGLPKGFNYSKWVPDGQLASAGRVNKKAFPRTYAGLDQVSKDWPTTPVKAGQTITVRFFATAPHNPSVWDVWMTRRDWNPSQPLKWSNIEHLGRPKVTFKRPYYTFSVTIPKDRSGHHVLWIPWQRNDSAGEVFFSTSDILVQPVNDVCSTAATLTDGTNGPLSLDGATNTLPAASCGDGGPDMWFTYTASCTGTLRAETCVGSSNFDSIVSIWSGSCGSLKQIGCNDNSCGLLSAARAPVVANTRYYIKVSGHKNKTVDQFRLTMSYDNKTGSFATTTKGCGATLLAKGAPNLGGILGYTVSGGKGSTQLLWIGVAPTRMTLCTGCILGTGTDFIFPGSVSAQISCDPKLIGLSWYVQGADAVGTSGGCNYGGGLDFILTDAIRTTIGR